MVTCGSKEPPPQLTCLAVRGTSPSQLLGGDTLLIYWTGHGIMSMKRRLLLCADSSSLSDLRGIEVDSLLTRLRSGGFARTQIGFFDTCAQVMPAPAVLDLGGAGNVPAAQHFYFSASAAEVATADLSSELGFTRTVLRKLTDPSRPFPPAARPLFAELDRHFDEARLSTRAFPLHRTDGSGSDWTILGSSSAEAALLPYARAARATLGEFEHLRDAAAGCVGDQPLSDAVRAGTMDTLLASLSMTVSNPAQVRVRLLGYAWQRLSLARQLEERCVGLGLSWRAWQELSRKVRTLDNLPDSVPPDGLIGILLSVLDQARFERGIDSCIRLLALAARATRPRDRRRADAFESAVMNHPDLSARWASAVASLPRPTGPVFLLIALQGGPELPSCLVTESWLYRCTERDRAWQGRPEPASLVEQINELIERAKGDNEEGRLIVELAMPSDLICSPRELLELVDRELDTITWLEAGSAVIVRWQDRMKGAAKYQPGTWKQQARAAEMRLDDDPRLDVGWLDEPTRRAIVGVPFPGPSAADPKRNRKAFFEALLKGDPWT
jgi:hypothetical protein